MSEDGVRSIGVCLAGSARLLRELLSLFFQNQPHLNLVATSESVEKALAQVRSDGIDVLLLHLSPAHGISVDSVVTAIENSPSQAKVIVLGDAVSDHEAVRLAWCGVSGIFLTTGSAELLLKCVCKVAGGECWFDQNMVQAILHQSADLSAQNPPVGSDKKLTKREMQVLQLVLDGLSNKEIATRMDLRETSVKATLQGLFHKNGVRSRSQLVRVALERHLAVTNSAEEPVTGREKERRPRNYPPPPTL
jgi:two-component system, NarL family, nitrate/nitrite response regulator NarL